MTSQELLAKVEREARGELVRTGTLPKVIYVSQAIYDALPQKYIIIRGRVIAIEPQDKGAGQ